MLRSPARIERLEVAHVVDLSLSQIDPKGSVVDVGTGTGIFAEEFARRGLQVTGVDANPEMILSAKEIVLAATFKQGLAESLPFPDASCDLVFMGLLLHEVDDPLTALREAQRVSRTRTAVLEWRYEEQAFGPPLTDRISGERISQLALQAGFKRTQSIPLKSLVLYLLEH